MVGLSIWTGFGLESTSSKHIFVCDSLSVHITFVVDESDELDDMLEDWLDEELFLVSVFISEDDICETSFGDE